MKLDNAVAMQEEAITERQYAKTNLVNAMAKQEYATNVVARCELLTGFTVKTSTFFVVPSTGVFNLAWTEIHSSVVSRLLLKG